MGSKLRLPSGVEEGSITALRFKSINPISSIDDVLSGDVEPFSVAQKTAMAFLKFYEDCDWEALGVHMDRFKAEFVHWWNTQSMPIVYGDEDFHAQAEYSTDWALRHVLRQSSPAEVAAAWRSNLTGPCYWLARTCGDIIVAPEYNNSMLSIYHERGWISEQFLLDSSPSTVWRLRERLRASAGLYEAVPWTGVLPPIEGHYVHLAIGDKNKGLVAYTQTERKGESDIQTPIRAGAYLTKFYPDLTGDQVRDWVAKVDLGQPVLFAKTADEFEEVYVNGPNSCMSKSRGSYESHIHPVRVYAGHDLELAYLKSPDGTPSARALVWPAKKKVGRIYGDIQRLSNKLKDLGYQVDINARGALAGAKFSRVANGDGCLVMPYIDGCCSFDDHGTYCTIEGDYEAESTNGLVSLGSHEEYCEYYEENRDEDQYEVYVNVHSTQMWSETAFNNHGYMCYASLRCYSDDVPCTDVRIRHGTETWADYHLDNAFFCELTNEWYSCDNYDCIVVASGETGEANYVRENFTECSVDNEWYPNDEMIELPDGSFVHTSNHDDSEEAAQAAA